MQVMPWGTSMRSSDSGGRVCRAVFGGGGGREDWLMVALVLLNGRRYHRQVDGNRNDGNIGSNMSPRQKSITVHRLHL